MIPGRLIFEAAFLLLFGNANTLPLRRIVKKNKQQSAKYAAILHKR